jgi:hypothetical protein
MIDVDYRSLDGDLEDGTFRQRLEDALTEGFRSIHASGERLPTASHFAAQIAEIVNGSAPVPLAKETAFELYQEILSACERARAAVLGEPESPA